LKSNPSLEGIPMANGTGWKVAGVAAVVVTALGLAAVAGAFTPQPRSSPDGPQQARSSAILDDHPADAILPAPVVEAEPRPSNRRPDVRSSARPLVEAVAARIEAFEALQERLVDQHYAVTLAEHEVNSALTALQISEVALRDFREGLFPQMVRQVQAEHHDALEKFRFHRFQDSWSGVMEKQGARSKTGTELGRQQVADAKDAIDRAEARAKELSEVVYPQQVQQLQDRIAEARKGVQLHRDDLARKRRTARELEAKVDRESLSPAERRAIILIDECLALVEVDRPEEARDRLEEANGFWQAEQERRAVARREAQRRTIKDAADRYRDTIGSPHSGPRQGPGAEDSRELTDKDESPDPPSE